MLYAKCSELTRMIEGEEEQCEVKTLLEVITVSQNTFLS